MGLFRHRAPGEDVTKPNGEGVVKKALGALGHAFPKGIRLPDQTVRNTHLYMPSKGPKKRTRLF